MLPAEEHQAGAGCGLVRPGVAGAAWIRLLLPVAQHEYTSMEAA